MTSGRTPVAALTMAYGLLVAVANARNDIITNEFTRSWVLFGGSGGFPGDFGRNVFAGTVALGVVVIGVGLAVRLTAGTPPARWVGLAVWVFAVALILFYRDSGNLLGARPSAAAALSAVSLYMAASSLPVRRVDQPG